MAISRAPPVNGLIAGPKSAAEKAYSLEEIKRDNLVLDIPYYISNHYAKSLCKILDLVVDGTSEMFADAKKLAEQKQ